MNQIQFQPIRLSSTDNGSPVKAISGSELEQTIGVALISDYDEQLAKVANTMRETLNQKKIVSSELTGLQSIATKTPQIILGDTYFELTTEEAISLKSKYPKLGLKEENGKTLISKDSLEALVSGKQDELAGLNSNSEITSLQIQSLVDQRKQALTLLSNLIASKNDTAMAIIRNIKN